MRRSAILLGGLMLVAGARGTALAQTEPGTVAAHDRYILDEYNLDVMAAPDSGRISAGLGFGTVYANGWWWTAGPRLSFVRWHVDVPAINGFGFAGAFGTGWRPQKTVSPYGGIVLERDFAVDGLFDWQAVIHAGARVKVSDDPREHIAITFSLYHTSVYGGDGPGGNDTGIAIMYSAVLFAKHR